MQMVISCQRPFDMWNLSGRVYQNVLKSPGLKDKLKIGSYSKKVRSMLGNQMAVLKGAKNPNAAKLFVEFLLSEEGADLFVEGEAVYFLRAKVTSRRRGCPLSAGPVKAQAARHGRLGWRAKDYKTRIVRLGRKTSARSYWKLQSFGAPTFRRPVNLRVLTGGASRDRFLWRFFCYEDDAECCLRTVAPKPNQFLIRAISR